MSNSSVLADAANGRLRYGWRAACRGARVMAFWSAVTLPLLYLPLLVAGLQSGTEWLAFGILLGIHVITVFAGRTHHQ